MNEENKTTDADKIEKILTLIEKEVEGSLPFGERVEEETKDPFLVLVSVILSARTKDETTEVVCKKLFKRVKKPQDLKRIGQTKLETILKPIGFYRQKANYLKKTAKILLEKYDGKVPDTFEELIKLPGVGRKTANLVLSLSFGKNTICVDTHVHRISNRLGLVKTKSPVETEMELMKVLPEKWWSRVNTIFVLYGKSVCTPLRPKCDICVVRSYCKFSKNRKN